jgi:hypothetical protein
VDECGLDARDVDPCDLDRATWIEWARATWTCDVCVSGDAGIRETRSNWRRSTWSRST